jgi:hypothetical protein
VESGCEFFMAVPFLRFYNKAIRCETSGSSAGGI